MAVRLLWPLLFMATAVRGATKRPFERMQQATGQADAAGKPVLSKTLLVLIRARSGYRRLLSVPNSIVPSSSMLPPVSSSCGATTASWSAGAANAGPSVAMLQSIMKNGGMDPIEAISMGLNSPGYKVRKILPGPWSGVAPCRRAHQLTSSSSLPQLLLESADIQRRLLDEMPVLKAFKPFKELAENKQATDEEVSSKHPYTTLPRMRTPLPWVARSEAGSIMLQFLRGDDTAPLLWCWQTMSGFAAGMAQAFEFMKTSLTKIKVATRHQRPVYCPATSSSRCASVLRRKAPTNPGGCAGCGRTRMPRSTPSSSWPSPTTRTHR